MTHQIWTRVLVASLFLLGDGAFASEINHPNDSETVTSGNVFQIPQSALLDDPGSNSQPILPSVNGKQTAFNLTTQTNAAVTHSVLDTHKYHPLNPRAPPIPAK